MPSILFDLPTVAEHGEVPFQQRGNTCWYYTAKMLLRFHEMATTAQDVHYEQLKALHKVRQISTAISKRKYAVDKKASVVRDLKDSRDQLQQQLKEFELSAMKSQSPMLQDTMKPSIVTLRSASLSTEHVGALQNEGRIGAALDVLSTCGELAGGQLDRADMLDKFFKGQVFKVFNSNPTTVLDVFNILFQCGPVYGRGDLLDWKTEGETPLVKPMASGKRTKQQKVTAFRSGSHAVAICGADTTLNRIYYVDPNCTNVLRFADAPDMLPQMKPAQSGTMFTIMYVSCPRIQFSGQEVERCVHSNRGVLG